MSSTASLQYLVYQTKTYFLQNPNSLVSAMIVLVDCPVCHGSWHATADGLSGWMFYHSGGSKRADHLCGSTCVALDFQQMETLCYKMYRCGIAFFAGFVLEMVCWESCHGKTVDMVLHFFPPEGAVVPQCTAFCMYLVPLFLQPLACGPLANAFL